MKTDKNTSDQNDRNKFGEHALSTLGDSDSTTKAKYDSRRFCLYIPNGIPLNLHSFYRRYCESVGTAREEVFQHLSRAWDQFQLKLPETLEIAKSNLVPTIDAGTVSHVSQTGSESTSFVTSLTPFGAVGGQLAAGVGYAREDVVIKVKQDVLDQWEISFSEAMQIATQNLRDSTQSWKKKGEVFIMSQGDDFDASRILCTDLIRQLRVKGETIAMAPTKNLLLVTGSKSKSGLKTLLSLSKQAWKKQNVVSGIAFCLKESGWKPWLPPASHSLRSSFRFLQCQSLQSATDVQFEELTLGMAKLGFPHFVASLMYGDLPMSTELSTFCAWTDEVSALLPKTDYVAFSQSVGERSNKILGACKWQDVRNAVGYLMVPQKIIPERYLVTRFPSAAEFERMGLKRN